MNFRENTKFKFPPVSNILYWCAVFQCFVNDRLSGYRDHTNDTENVCNTCKTGANTKGQYLATGYYSLWTKTHRDC